MSIESSCRDEISAKRWVDDLKEKGNLLLEYKERNEEHRVLEKRFFSSIYV